MADDIKSLTSSASFAPHKDLKAKNDGLDHEGEHLRSSSLADAQILEVPSYALFEIFPDKKRPNSLVKPILERFPYQPPMPSGHPGLSYDHLIAKTLKGAPFFIAKLYRLDKDLVRVVMEKMRHNHDKIRFMNHLITKRRETASFDLLQIENEKNRTRAIYEKRAKKSKERKEIFINLLLKRFLSFKIVHKLMYQMRDFDKKDIKENYLKAFDKMREKKSFEIPTSGYNTANLLALLGKEKFPVRILLGLKKVEISLLYAFALQLMEHAYSGSVPTPVYHRLHSALDRHEMKKEKIRKVKLIANERLLAFLEKIKLKKIQIKREERSQQIDRIEARVIAYWKVYDKNHKPIKLEGSLSGQTLSDLRRKVIWQDFATLLNTVRITEGNINFAHEHQMLEHVQTLLPGLLTAITHEYNFMYHMQMHKDFENLVDKMLFWKLYDHHHQKLLQTVSLSVFNLGEVSRLMNSMRQSIVFYFLLNAKYQQLNAHRNQLNDHVQSFVQEILNFQSITFIYKDFIFEKSVAHVNEKKTLLKEVLQKLWMKRKVDTQTNDTQKQTKKAHLHKMVGLSASSLQEVKNKMVHLNPSEGVRLERAVKEIEETALASQIAEHAMSVNALHLRSHLSFVETETTRHFSEVVEKNGKDFVVEQVKILSSKLSNSAVSSHYEEAKHLDPKSEPISGDKDITVLAGKNKKSVIIDTYKEQERGGLYRNFPSLAQSLSGFESQYELNQPANGTFSQILPLEKSAHYPDVITVNRPYSFLKKPS